MKEYDELHIPELVFLVFKQPSNIVLKNLRLLHKFISDVCIVHKRHRLSSKTIELSIKLRTAIYDSLFLAMAEKYKTNVYCL